MEQKNFEQWNGFAAGDWQKDVYKRQMKKLYDYISAALAQHESTETRYSFICRSLVQYQEEFPFYFKMVLDKINIDFESQDYLPEEKETYQIGEEINEKIKEHLAEEAGDTPEK